MTMPVGEFKGIDKGNLFKAIKYTPHPGQVAYHESTARFKPAACGRRYGKSTMSANDKSPNLFEPKNRGWIVGPTYDLAEKEFRVFWDNFIVDLAFGKVKSVKKSYNKRQGDMYIEFPWGARVECRSADHAASLVGESLNWVILSEAAKHNSETWNRYIRPGLADTGGSADFPTTPEGWNWFYDLFKLGRDPNFPEYASFHGPSWLNPFVFPGGENDPEIKLLKATLSQEEFDQEIAALFNSFVGKIFPEWNEEVHVVELNEYISPGSDICYGRFNPAWKNYSCWDFGWTDPITCIEFQVTPWDQIRVWREYYKDHITLEDAIDECNSREQPPGYHVDLSFGDAADPEAIYKLCRLFGPTIGDPEAKVDWRRGINLVNRFLKLRHTGEADEYGTPLPEEPGMLVDFSCVNVRREANNYKRKKGTAGNDLTGSVVAQGDDHTLDPIRYGLMHLYELGATAHLSDVYVPNPSGLLVPAAPGAPVESWLNPASNQYGEFDSRPTGEAGIFTMDMEF